jgi:hypothetical protein
MAKQSDNPQPKVRWWTTVDDEIVEMPPVKIKPIKGQGRARKAGPNKRKKSA